MLRRAVRRDARRTGDPGRKRREGRGVRRSRGSFAAASLDREREVRELEQIVLQSSAAAEREKRAVEQNATMLHKRLAEREQLLSTLDRAKLQEQMNKALATLDDPVGDLVPTMAEVQKKIEDRLARAQSVASLNAAAGRDRRDDARSRGGRPAGRCRRPDLTAPGAARPRACTRR